MMSVTRIVRYWSPAVLFISSFFNCLWWYLCCQIMWWNNCRLWNPSDSAQLFVWSSLGKDSIWYDLYCIRICVNRFKQYVYMSFVPWISDATEIWSSKKMFLKFRNKIFTSYTLTRSVWSRMTCNFDVCQEN